MSKSDNEIKKIEKEEEKISKKIEEILNKDKPFQLRKVKSCVNLAHKGFKKLFENWYGKENIPKQVEMDLLFGFEAPPKKPDPFIIDDTVLIATEVKWFPTLKNEHFRKGIEQALAYALFGPDVLSLWQLFSKEIEDGQILKFIEPARTMIEVFKLPILYVAGKIIDKEEMKMKTFSPYTVDNEQELKDFIWPMFPTNVKEETFLLYHVPQEEIKKKIKERRTILKSLLITN